MPLFNSQSSIPDWADPKQASVMDPLYKTLARKAVGVLGIDDPAGSIMGAAAPMTMVEGAPANFVKNLLKMNVGPNEKAAGGLIEHLLGYKEPKPNLNGLVAGSKVTRYLEPPLRYGAMLNRMESRVPEAAGAFETPGYKVVGRAPGLSSTYSKEAGIRNPAIPQEAGLMGDMLKGRYDRTAVRSLDELRDLGSSLANSPKTETTSIKSAFYGTPQNGRHNSSTMNALKRTKLTEDDIRAIRGLTPEDAASKYPHLKMNTIAGIRKNDTFRWVR